MELQRKRRQYFVFALYVQMGFPVAIFGS